MEVLLAKLKTGPLFKKRTLIHSDFFFSSSMPSANPGPVVLILTANEIKPGTHSPTLLANAQETPAFACWVCLSLHLTLTQYTRATIPSDRFLAPVCVCVCVKEGLGVMCAMILVLQSSSFANCSY